MKRKFNFLEKIAHDEALVRTVRHMCSRYAPIPHKILSEIARSLDLDPLNDKAILCHQILTKLDQKHEDEVADDSQFYREKFSDLLLDETRAHFFDDWHEHESQNLWPSKVPDRKGLRENFYPWFGQDLLGLKIKEYKEKELRELARKLRTQEEAPKSSAPRFWVDVTSRVIGKEEHDSETSISSAK